jgi:acyl carrier protein
MYEVLKRILVDDIQLRTEDITPAAGCAEVGLDSLTAVELSIVLNNRLGIEIHDYELLELATVGDVARLMEQRRLAGPVDPAEAAA